MGQQRKSSADSRKMEIEKAALCFKERMMFATLQANGNASVTVQSLKPSWPSSPSPISSAYNSPPTNHTSPMDPVEYKIGLGLGIDAIKEQEDQMSIKSEPQSMPSTPTFDAVEANVMDRVVERASPKKVAEKSPSQVSKREPCLYDAIFGKRYTQSKRQQEKTQGHRLPPNTPPALPSSNAIPSPRQPPMARSPHVRQGSSAHLEKLASSPHHNLSPKWYQQRHSIGGGGGGMHAHFSDNIVDSFAHPVGSPSQLRRQSADQQSLPFSSNFGSRQRMKSAGGSVLPNGHPASSLAQDLGIASGRTPRSRNASSNGQLPVHPRNDDFNQEEANRLGGFLSGDMDTRTTPHFATSSSSFPDPNLVVTPRRGPRKRRVSGENEAAAQSLLVLAASPSPNRHHHIDRFAGATPSLDRILDSSRSPNHTNISRRLVGNLEDDELEGSTSKDTSTTTALQPAVSLRKDVSKRFESPPMTPPLSNRRRQNKTYFDPDSDDSSPCPTTPTRRGQMVLMSEEQESKRSELGRPLHPTVSSPPTRSIKTEDDSIVNETPRTPPPLHTPSTPKAPGSFYYGEYLHCSPSPKPRMRQFSSNGSAVGLTPRMNSLNDTPTRGTKSRSRFIDFEGMDMNSGDDIPLTPGLLSVVSDEVLIPGKRPVLEASPRIGAVAKKSKLMAD